MDDSALAWLPRFLAHLSRRTRACSPHTDRATRATCSASSRICDRSNVRRLAARRQPARARCSPPPSSGAARSPRTSSAACRRCAASSTTCCARGALDSQSGRGRAGAQGAKRLPGTLDVDQMARLLEFRTDDAARRARQGDHGAVLFLRPAPVGAGRPRPRRPRSRATARCACSARAARRASCRSGRKARRSDGALAQERATLAEHGRARVVRRQRGGRLGAAGDPAAHRALGAAAGAAAATCIRTCSGIRSPRICLNRVRICAACRSCSATPNISTTQIYTHLDFQHLARIYDAAHPRANARRKVL